jgi:hypothetical protein
MVAVCLFKCARATDKGEDMRCLACVTQETAGGPNKINNLKIGEKESIVKIVK